MNTLACLGILLAAVTPSFVNHNKVPGNTPTMTNVQTWSETVATSNDVSSIVTNHVNSGYLCTVAAVNDNFVKSNYGSSSISWSGEDYLNLNATVIVGSSGGGVSIYSNYFEDKSAATVEWVRNEVSGYSWSWDRINNTPKTIAGYGITNAYTKAEAGAKFMQTTDTASFANGAKMLTPYKYQIGSYDKIAFADKDGKTDVPYVRYRNGVTMESLDSYLVPDGTAFATLTSISNTCYTKADSDAKFLSVNGGTVAAPLEIVGTDIGEVLVIDGALISITNGQDHFWFRVKEGGTKDSELYPDNSPVATSNMVNGIVPQFIDHTLPHFSNQVLAVGFGMSSNDVAVICKMAGTIGNLPIGGGVATLGGLLMAVIASLKWLKSNKANAADLPIALTVYNDNTHPISTLDCVDGHAYTVKQAGTASTTDITVNLPQVSNAVATAFQATFVNTSADYTLTLGFHSFSSEEQIKFDGNDCGVVNKTSSAILSAMWNGTAWNLVWKNKAS